jgi:methionine biosynthesis protein MetW
VKYPKAEIIKDWTGSKEGGIFWRHNAALELISKEPVLDLGGGEGILLSMLRKQKDFSKLALVDISQDKIKSALTKNFDARFADITAPLPYSDDTFQTACAVDVLEHLQDPLPTLLEMKRVAHTVVFVVPNFNYWKARIQMLAGGIPFQCKAKREHKFWFNFYILQNIIEKTGMRVDRILVEGVTRYGVTGKCLARLLPNMFSYEFAVRLIRTD